MLAATRASRVSSRGGEIERLPPTSQLSRYERRTGHERQLNHRDLELLKLLINIVITSDVSIFRSKIMMFVRVQR